MFLLLLIMEKVGDSSYLVLRYLQCTTEAQILFKGTMRDQLFMCLLLGQVSLGNTLFILETIDLNR